VEAPLFQGLPTPQVTQHLGSQLCGAATVDIYAGRHDRPPVGNGQFSAFLQLIEDDCQGHKPFIIADDAHGHANLRVPREGQVFGPGPGTGPCCGCVTQNGRFWRCFFRIRRLISWGVPRVRGIRGRLPGRRRHPDPGNGALR